MPEFDFRLRFHLLHGDCIQQDAEELVVLEDERGRRLRLKSGEAGIPISQRSRAALIGGPYQSEDGARQAAALAKRALLIWAVTKRVGVDLGDGKLRGGLTTCGLGLLEAKLGRPVRNDVHGIDVYPHQEGVVFVSFEVNASVGKDPKAFVETVGSCFREPLPLTDKQVVACELYCSSFFDVSFQSRLITLVSAVEALLEPTSRCPAALALVDSFQGAVRNADLSNATKEAMVGSLQWLRHDSIGQTGRTLSERLLRGKKYLGNAASGFFRLCYELRSQIVHNGRPHDPGVDLANVTKACQAYVADLLLASFAEPGVRLSR